MSIRLLLLLCVVGCDSPTLGLDVSALDAPCSLMDAHPDDDIDDRVQLQLAADACVGRTLQLEPGVYLSSIPPNRGSRWCNLKLHGVLRGNNTTIAYSGDAERRDWNGICLQSDGAAVIGINHDGSGVLAGTTNEQHHLVYADGRAVPLHNLTVTYNRFWDPEQAGSKRGDSIRLIGYNNVADQRLIGIDVGNNDFAATGRADVTFFGAVQDLRIHDNVNRHSPDQPYDGENPVGGGSNIEIDHNVVITESGYGSAIWLQAQHVHGLHVHHNYGDTAQGPLLRGLDIMDCSGCELNDMHIIQTPSHEDAVITLRKVGLGFEPWNVDIHDVVLERLASAGQGALVQATNHPTSPTRVRVANATLVQHTSAPAVTAIGVVGLMLDHVTAQGTGTAVEITGSTTVRTTDLHVLNSQFAGWRVAVLLSGSYAGAGSLEVAHVQSDGAVVCQNITPSVSASGVVISGISGPITYYNNTMPSTNCQ